jgi:hypothetical protein
MFEKLCSSQPLPAIIAGCELCAVWRGPRQWSVDSRAVRGVAPWPVSVVCGSGVAWPASVQLCAVWRTWPASVVRGSDGPGRSGDSHFHD